MDWNNFQIEIVDPSGEFCNDPTEAAGSCTTGTLPWLKVVGNVGSAHTQGVQGELAWVPADGWDIGANAAWLEAETDEEYLLDPRRGRGNIVKGLRLPNVPKFKASLHASYSWPVQFIPGAEMVLRGQFSHTGNSVNKLIPAPAGAFSPSNPSFKNKAYQIADFSLGLINHNSGWEVRAFVNNITDERAQVYNSTGNFEYALGNSSDYSNYHRVTTLRPREFGMRFNYKWGG